MATNDRLAYLFQNYLDKTYSLPEKEELFGYIREAEYDTDLRELIEETWNGHFAMYEQNEREADILFQQILLAGRIRARVRRIRMWRWVAAASILLIVGVLTWLIVGVPANKHRQEQVATTHDVAAPKETRAVITLANGSKVYLDNVDNGTIAREQNIAVVKNDDGSIVYSHEGAKAQDEVAYNTMFNPRGSKVISLTLSDGTRVWLNSESSLKYPTAFNGNTREVEITGEAYFEVKHNTKQPFQVHLPNGSVVEDIGTAFNENAYPEEEATKTTLVEGSIKISSRLRAFVAKPKAGEQVIEKPNSPLTTDHSPDLEEVLAWKNGLFHFNSADLNTVMRQVERWYDVNVVYNDKIDISFSGEMKRNTSLSEMLRAIQLTAKVKFSIEGKNVIVSR